jgi:hypothetical protein
MALIKEEAFHSVNINIFKEFHFGVWNIAVLERFARR